MGCRVLGTVSDLMNGDLRGSTIPGVEICLLGVVCCFFCCYGFGFIAHYSSGRSKVDSEKLAVPGGGFMYLCICIYICAHIYVHFGFFGPAVVSIGVV